MVARQRSDAVQMDVFRLGIVGVTLLGVVVMMLVLPSTSSAMRVLSSDFGDKDPCAQLGIGNQCGVVTKHNIAGKESEKPVNVEIQCSPLLKMPFGTLLAGDLVANNNDGNHRGDPFFVGNVEADGWLNTKGQPYIHGNIAEALRLQQFQGSKAIVDALISAGAGVTSTLAASLIICAVGGVPTLGLACGTTGAIVGGAVVAALVGATGAVIKDFINAQYNRIKAMGDADWFVWSNTLVTWNSFGDITDTSINPSLTDVNANPFHTDYVRIGVQWSNVPVGQGSEFFSAKEGGKANAESSSTSSHPVSAAQVTKVIHEISSLNFNAGPDGIDPSGRKRVRTGTRGPNLLRGGPGDDVLQSLGSNDRVTGGPGDDYINGGSGSDRLWGNAGRDIMMGRSGNDMPNGGPGHDILIGGAGADTLIGGPGSDWMFDSKGPTVVRTGRHTGKGTDVVNVRDGRGDDVVYCESGKTLVYADRGDRIVGHCGRIVRRGPLLRMPG